MEPRRGRQIWATAVATAAAVLVAATLFSLVSLRDRIGVLDRRIASDDASVARLRRDLADAASANAAVSARVAELQPVVSDQIDVAAVTRRVQPSVFTVDTPNGLGSGWVAKSSGSHSLIVTAFHVVADVWNGNRTVGLRQADRVITGTVTKADQAADLAVIDVGEALPSISVRTSPPVVGEAVAAFGSPLDFGGSVTSGVVSAIRGEGIQFTAPISPGSSGGPIVDRTGTVVGITQKTVVGAAAQSLNFAIPASAVCALGVC